MSAIKKLVIIVIKKLAYYFKALYFGTINATYSVKTYT